MLWMDYYIYFMTLPKYERVRQVLILIVFIIIIILIGIIYNFWKNKKDN